MYAIIETGGKQYRVSEGATITVDKLEAAQGAEYVVEKVLLVGGGDFKVGSPYVAGASVTCEVAAHERGKKLTIFHKWRRNDSHKKQGHRQDYTKLKVKSIQA